MESRDCVEIEAYNAAGDLVLTQVISRYEWYEERHPIIDSSEERRRLQIRGIEGRQYDFDGILTVRWRSLYTETGAISESWEWRGNEPEKYTRYGEPS